MVTGCNSNTRGFSNSVSDLLESVNKAKEGPYEVISGEDMLAKVENYIKEAEEIMKEGREKLCRKMRCKGEKHRTEGTAILARCVKVWEMKSRQVRGETEDDQEQQECGEGCRVEKSTEVMRFRIHQYTENPAMELS